MDNKKMFLPRHMRNVEHLAAFEETVAKRFGDIDMSPCMMYLVDTCSSLALPFLADQFDVAQFRDYQLATTDDQRRSIIKDAIKTHAYMGTVWVIKNAMISLGFDPAWLVERCNEGLDPVYGWADFKLSIPAGLGSITGVPASDLSELILQYKPARCRYLGADFITDGYEDTFLDGTESIPMHVGMIVTGDTLGLAPFKYDGAHKYDGSMKYRSKCEAISITIV